MMPTQRGSQAPKWSSTVTPMNAMMIRTAPQKNNQEKEACIEREREREREREKSIEC